MGAYQSQWKNTMKVPVLHHFPSNAQLLGLQSTLVEWTCFLRELLIEKRAAAERGGRKELIPPIAYRGSISSSCVDVRIFIIPVMAHVNLRRTWNVDGTLMGPHDDSTFRRNLEKDCRSQVGAKHHRLSKCHGRLQSLGPAWARTGCCFFGELLGWMI